MKAYNNLGVGGMGQGRGERETSPGQLAKLINLQIQDNFKITFE